MSEPNENKCLGVCCYCGDGCNIHSQSCGRCAHSITNYNLGDNLPSHLEYIKYTTTELKQIQKVVKKDTLNK